MRSMGPQTPAPDPTWDRAGCKADILIAACHISAKTFAVSVVGPTQACVFCLPRAVLSDEHAVVMLGVLVQQTAVHKLPDHLRGDAAFAQVGKDSAVIRIPGWQGKGLLHLVPLDGRHCFGGGISGPAIEGEQILDSFRKCLVAELLHESDGVAARVLRVAEPCATVLDPQAVHFCCGVVPANAFDLIARWVSSSSRSVSLTICISVSVKRLLISLATAISSFLLKRKKPVMAPELFGCHDRLSSKSCFCFGVCAGLHGAFLVRGVRVRRGGLVVHTGLGRGLSGGSPALRRSQPLLRPVPA